MGLRRLSSTGSMRMGATISDYLAGVAPVPGWSQNCRRMGRVARILLAIATFCAAGVVADLKWGPHARLGPGRRLPEFELSAPRTSAVHSSDWAGKVILLDFFASW